MLALNQIPELDQIDFQKILQSIIHVEAGKNGSFGFLEMPVESFATMRWKELPVPEEERATFVHSFGAMFGVEVMLPDESARLCDVADACFEAWQNGKRTVTFMTSGSTGTPKACTHRETELRQELLGILPQLGSVSRIVVTVPLHHLFGFTFGVLLPKAMQVPALWQSPLPTAVATGLRRGDVAVGIPLLWEKVLELVAGSVADNVQIICGTAPLRDGVFRKLRDAGFKVLEIFGSSETGVLCTRTEAASPFALMPHFVHILSTHGAEELVERQLPGGGTRRFPLQDRFCWSGERQLVPEGRTDCAVQVGGVNVFPEKVARCLRGHPDVADCSVRLMRPEEGSRLKAYIVLKRGQPDMPMRRSLRAFVKSRLASAEQPVRFDFGEELPRNSMGKLADW